MEVILLLSCCLTLLFLSLSQSAPTELLNITAESGQNVSLSCKAQNNNPVTFVEWSKYGLKKGYVLLYRDERFDVENQHPSFKNRLDLQDRQMKDGDVSLILKDVTLDDHGTYECRVETQVNRRKRANQGDDPISTINLKVVPPGQRGGDTEDAGKKEGGSENIRNHSLVGLPVLAVLVFGILVAFLFYRKQHSEFTPASC